MNILAIDYGEKRIGLAWCEIGLDVVLPFGVLTTDGQKVMAEQLADLVKKEKIGQLVIGLPLGLDGQENANTKRVREFARQLREFVSAPMEFVDERFTSAGADRLVGNASRDEKAAMAILETYLEKKSGMSGKPCPPATSVH